MNKVLGIVLCALVAAASHPVHSQAQTRAGIVAHAGTMGLGADVAISPAPKVGLRAGGNFMPVEPSFTVSDIDFTLALQSPQFTAMVDLYPVGGFRLSGGLRYTSSNIELTGDYTGTIDIGGTTYSGTQVGTLTGVIEVRDLAPYVGIGFGNPTGSKLGFFFELGAAYQGAPTVTLHASGTAASLPAFQADLAQERQDIEDDLGVYFKFYPVLTLGFSIGF